MIDIPTLLRGLNNDSKEATGSITKAELQTFIDAEISKGANSDVPGSRTTLLYSGPYRITVTVY